VSILVAASFFPENVGPFDFSINSSPFLATDFQDDSYQFLLTGAFEHDSIPNEEYSSLGLLSSLSTYTYADETTGWIGGLDVYNEPIATPSSPIKGGARRLGLDGHGASFLEGFTDKLVMNSFPWPASPVKTNSNLQNFEPCQQVLIVNSESLSPGETNFGRDLELNEHPQEKSPGKPPSPKSPKWGGSSAQNRVFPCPNLRAPQSRVYWSLTV
jgi:hypothetical protein